MNQSFSKILFFHFEWVVLASGVTAMALLNPWADAASFCLINRLGFSFCPGTGLGRSVALLFRGEFAASFEMNVMGIPAVAILSARIITIWKRNLKLTGELP